MLDAHHADESDFTETDNPHDLEVEGAVIGVLVRYPGAIKQADDLRPEHFYAPQYQEIFTEVVRLISSGSTIDPLLLAKTFGQKYHKLIASWYVEAGSNSINLRHYADIVIELHHRRLLIKKTKESLKELRDGAKSSTIVTKMQGIFNNSLSEIGGRKFHDCSTVTQNIAHNLLNQKACTKTGLKELDDALGGGLFAGKAYAFAARKKIGKTILASTISHNLNMDGVKHLFICGEMGEEEIHQRVVARQLSIFPSKFLSQFSDRNQLAEDVAAMAKTMPRNTIYYNAPGISFEELRRTVGLAKIKYDIEGFVLDYWQLVRGKGKNESKADHQENVAQWIADIGKKLNIWSITTAQLNSDGNTRGGEGIRLTHDQVFEIHRPQRNEPQTWLEMLETRHTSWKNVGSEKYPGLLLNEKGPFFEDSNIEMPSDEEPIYSTTIYSKPFKKRKLKDILEEEEY